MATYRLSLITERKIDEHGRRVEVLACGHVHVMTHAERIAFRDLGPVEKAYTSRRCVLCADAEQAQKKRPAP